MKVVAYGIQPSEKGILAHANNKKHDITLISNPLTTETAFYAKGKEVVILFTGSAISGPILEVLVKLGIRFIASRSDTIDSSVPETGTADQYGILWANVSFSFPPGQVPTLEDLQKIAAKTISQIDNWQLLA